MNFDWNHVKAFLVTAKEGSLSSAAKALYVSQPTISRQVAALEEELSVALFERGPAGFELTPSGVELVEYAQQMGDIATKLSLAATGQSQAIEGNICISATEVAAAYVLPPIVNKLRDIQPRIQLEIIATQEASDIRRREADIALRAFRPTQPYLIARRLPDSHHYLYASKSYLESIDTPTTIEELSRATFLGFDRTETLIDIYRPLGLDLTQTSFPVIIHDQVVQLAMAKSGMGIAVMPEEVGKLEPTMVKVLPDQAPFTTENWLVTHRELHTNRRVRIVFDFLAECLQESLQPVDS